VAKAVVDVSSIDTATEVLGTKMAFPIMVSPTAAHGALHPDGEAGMREGCSGAADTPMIVSQNASMPMDKIGADGSAPLWYQIYPRPRIQDSLASLDAARAAGCRAIVATIDQQAAYYERQIHDQHLSDRPTRQRRRARATAASNPYRVPAFRLWYEWRLFDELRAVSNLPLLAKGILTAEDARRCVEQGLDGIVVSNHGGRSLDYVPSTLEVLPEIVDAVGGRIPVLIDSGFRRGSDILKALALGASAVCLGRAPRWGLAAFGAMGVQRVLEIIQAELVLAMAHTGRPDLASIDRSLARTEFP
jgi:isopentenyl diphosphate isomerase/L-lactate dehydrogenase-like FMN-dependent dehydrogenase